MTKLFYPPPINHHNGLTMDINNSQRLSYRFLTATDAELFCQLDQDPEVMRFITQGKTSTIDDIKKTFIPRLEQYANKDKGWGMWGAFIEESGEFIGWVLVRPMKFFSDKAELDNLELGWRFLKNSWGKGYASEAALHIKNQLAKNTSIKAFSAIADENNLGSIGVMKKIGMSYLKTYHHVDPPFECDVAYYQMINA